MLALLLLASPPVITEMCEKAWVETEKPAPEDTRTCARHLLELAYGPGWTEDDLTLDPPSGGSTSLRFTARQLETMAAHVRATCGLVCDDVEKQPVLARAAEWASREATVRFDLIDPARMDSTATLFAQVLTGKALTKKAIDGLSSVSLWRLRNAVFARHGKTFEHPDLTRFFYGPGATLKDLKPKDAAPSLTKADKANVALIQAQEKRS